MKKKYCNRYLYYLLIVFLSGTFLLGSCRKEDDEDIEPNIENRAFHDLMVDWYYWNDEIPENFNPDLYKSPYEVMEALRSDFDPWSYISTRQEFEAYYRDAKFIGYGFGSAFDDNGKLRVSFIFNTSDMYLAGVRRSWILERVNGTLIQPGGTSINQLLGANEIGVSNVFLFIKPDGTQQEMTLQKKEVFMNTVLHTEVLQTGDKLVGYLAFKGFTDPSFDELDEAVAIFNAAGIDDLVLDMRYNGGGQTNVANYLASIIGGNALTGLPFSKYMYNENQAAEYNFTDNFFSTTRKPAQTLGLDRLITIATRATASASEMVINGLMHYMDVYIVGDDTYGKPMGMNAWYYGNLYAFVPVTFKIANAAGDGDYFNGLPANSKVVDDLSRLFGDPEESMLKEALNFIETGTFSGTFARKSLFLQPFEQMTGLRAEIGAH
jgi:carboxyl-terminal processing protease